MPDHPPLQFTEKDVPPGYDTKHFRIIMPTNEHLGEAPEVLAEELSHFIREDLRPQNEPQEILT